MPNGEIAANTNTPMLFMVVARFRNCDPKPIYRRLRDQGVIPGAGRPRSRRKSGSYRTRR